jgi:hypothetical protein
VSAGSTQARLIALRGQPFYVLQTLRRQVEGHMESTTLRYGPFMGAFFDPTMASPGGPNTEVQDIRDDKGWRVNYMPLISNGRQITLRDKPDERDSIDAVTKGIFVVIKVTPIGKEVDGLAESYRAILERQN